MAGDVAEMSAGWKCDDLERARRLVDLATVSVFMDAGAGSGWSYNDGRGIAQSRSEGLAIASFDMFRGLAAKNNLSLLPARAR